jgi:hypothetical protein
MVSKVNIINKRMMSCKIHDWELDELMFVWWSNIDHLIRRHTGVGRACWNCAFSDIMFDELFFCGRKTDAMINNPIKEVCDWWQFRERRK